jgi:hypothetical protein
VRVRLAAAPFLSAMMTRTIPAVEV